ncbi:hypothetical protein B0H14DRAFT_3583894 [Mycena olivaceomarginata]|nr:hypothetical protein B0H14DRAFT_3583894 [Mycena olivaceomarginata]
MTHPNFLLNSRTLIIGSSSGIGYAVASGALANGAKVHITSVTSQKLFAKIAQLQSLYSGAHVSGSVADLSNTETLEANLQSVLDAALPLEPLAELTATTALSAFTVRYLGPLLIGKLVAANPGKYLNPAASSSITLTCRRGADSSTCGRIGANQGECDRSRCSGTELVEQMFKGNPEVLSAFEAASLTKKIGTPEGAAEAYLFSMRSALATGQDFKPHPHHWRVPLGWALQSLPARFPTDPKSTSPPPPAEKLSTKIKQLQSLYPNAHVSGSTVDLSNTETLETDMQSLLDAALKQTGGPLDHIVCTAGEGPNTTPLADITTTRALSTFTKPRKYVNPAASSSITLTSGVLNHRPRRGIFMLGAAGAVEVLTRSLAVELAPIRANAVIVGAVRTELIEKMTGGDEEFYKAATLTREVGTPEAAAEGYLFCMRSALATGQGVAVDGGFFMLPA